MVASIPESFCLLPWVHAHVNAQGYRRLCGVDAPKAKFDFGSELQSLEEYWNSDEVKAVRLQMLAGMLPARCVNCSPSSHRAVTYKDDVLATWPREIDNAIASTGADGSTSLQPFSFDYRSSTCNLRCRICGPHSSSSSEIEARKHPALQEIGEVVSDWDEAYVNRRSNSGKLARADLMTAAREGRIRHLYWAGGEPLMDETHWAVMIELVRSGKAAEVDVAYNSNLTVFSYHGQKVEDIWPHFRNVHFQVSIDGVDEAGEYIRTGFKTKVFARHLGALLDMASRHPQLKVALDLTLTSVGLLHLGAFLDFALAHHVVVTAKLMVPRDINRYMAVEFLPGSVKDDWCRKWMAWIERNDRDGLFRTLYATLEVALRRRSFQLVPDASFDNGYDASVIAAFEAARGDVGTFRRLISVDPRLEGLVGPAPSGFPAFASEVE